MPQSLTRRHFFKYALLASSATAASGSLFAPLRYGAAVNEQVGAILRQYLNVGGEHRALVANFTRSLTRLPAHTASPEASRAILAGSRGPIAKEQYIIQEFIAATNYRAWCSGKESSLRLLVKHRGRAVTDPRGRQALA